MKVGKENGGEGRVGWMHFEWDNTLNVYQIAVDEATTRMVAQDMPVDEEYANCDIKCNHNINSIKQLEMFDQSHQVYAKQLVRWVNMILWYRQFENDPMDTTSDSLIKYL